MRFFLVFGLAISILLLSGCDTYKMEDLYGTWKGEVWEMTVEEGDKCRMINNGHEYKDCTYNTIGNALEIASEGSVFLSNLTVKGIENDVLSLEFRTLGASNIRKLNRVK